MDFMKDPKSLACAVESMPVQLKANEHEPPSNKILEGCLYRFTDENDIKHIVMFGEILFRPSGIIGRGTIVVRVSCFCGGNRGCNCSWKGLRLIMKSAFPVKDGHRRPISSSIARIRPRHSMMNGFLSIFPRCFARSLCRSTKTARRRSSRPRFQDMRCVKCGVQSKKSFILSRN